MWRPSPGTEPRSRPAEHDRGTDTAPGMTSQTIEATEIKTGNTDLVKWNEDPHQKLLVFCFQRQGEPVNNRSQDLKKLSYSVKVFGLINKPKVERRLIMGRTNAGAGRCSLDRI